MTQKPRSSYTDHTRKLRSGRRNAILNAAAVRMGFSSWVTFSTAVRRVMESANTDSNVFNALGDFLSDLAKDMPNGKHPDPPADMQAILATYPPRKSGRPKSQLKPEPRLPPEAYPVVLLSKEK